MKTAEELRSALHAIDHRSYPAYKFLVGSWSFGTYLDGLYYAVLNMILQEQRMLR